MCRFRRSESKSSVPHFLHFVEERVFCLLNNPILEMLSNDTKTRSYIGIFKNQFYVEAEIKVSKTSSGKPGLLLNSG